MAYDAHKNFAYATVLTAPSPATTGTSLVVAAGQGTRFPAVPFNATVWPANVLPTPANAEIVRVTAISTDTLTITRAQETSTGGPAARTILVGDQIAATITVKTLTDIEAGTNFTALSCTAKANLATAGSITSGFVDGINLGSYDAIGYNTAGTTLILGGYRSSQWTAVSIYTSATERLSIDTSGVLTVTGAGAHVISGSNTGSHNTLSVKNTATTGDTFGRFQAVGNATQTEVWAFAASYGTATWQVASGSAITANAAGGLSIVALDAAGLIRFYSGGATERSRFLANGDYVHGTGSNAVVLSGRHTIAFNASSHNGLVLNDENSISGGIFASFGLAGSSIGTIQRNAATSAVLYNTTSDQRLKLDHGLATDLSALRAIRVHDFTWKSDDSQTLDRGVFAQEAYIDIKRGVTPGTNGDDTSKPWMVDKSAFVPDLIVGWQQHESRLAALEARLK